MLAMLAASQNPNAQPQTGTAPVDPNIAALNAAVSGQANLGQAPAAQPVLDEDGNPIEDARAGKPRDVSDFLSHPYHSGNAQAPTSNTQVRHQGPSMQYVGQVNGQGRGASEGDPTADSGRQAVGLYNVPTSANEPRKTMQVPQRLLNSDQFRSEMDNATGDRQAIVDRWTADSMTDVEKQNAAYEQQQAGVRATNAQHPLTSPWTMETQNGPQHALTTFQPQNSAAAMLQPGQPQSPIGPNQATGEPMGQNTGANMLQGPRPGGTQTQAPPWAQQNGNQTTWTDSQYDPFIRATGLPAAQQAQLHELSLTPGVTPAQLMSQANKMQTQAMGGTSAFDPLIKNSGLDDTQQQSIKDWLTANPGAKLSDAEAAIRMEREATAQGTKASQAAFVNQGNALKVKVDRARRDLAKADADLKANSGPLADDDAHQKAQGEYDTANRAYGDAMDDLYEHANAGPQPIQPAAQSAATQLNGPGASAQPTPGQQRQSGGVMPMNPRMAQQVQQGGPPPMVTSEADLQHIAPGTTVNTPKGVMVWDGQRLTPVGQ
jgi:hypothetical protein